MPWSVYFPGGNRVDLQHTSDETGGLWGGPVEIWRGAPSATDHPEIEHAFLRLRNLALHKDFIRHSWSWEIPDYYQDLKNFGDDRRYMVLSATGGMLNWTLVLRFPPRTPQFIFAAVAAAFNATSKHVSPPEERLATIGTKRLRAKRAAAKKTKTTSKKREAQQP
jgi:hypothetical protein